MKNLINNPQLLKKSKSSKEMVVENSTNLDVEKGDLMVIPPDLDVCHEDESDANCCELFTQSQLPQRDEARVTRSRSNGSKVQQATATTTEARSCSAAKPKKKTSKTSKEFERARARARAFQTPKVLVERGYTSLL